MKIFSLVLALITLLGAIIFPQFAVELLGAFAVLGVQGAMCTIIALDEQADCPEAQGGIYQSYLTECSNITLSGTAKDVDDQITTLVMTGLGLWVKWVYDDDDTAFYNETGERQGNLHVFNQQAFLKFGGLTNTKRKVANGIKDCCCIVAIHFLNNGTQVVQGIEEDSSGNWRYTSRSRAKATVSLLSGTGAEEDRAEISIDSISRAGSYVTTLDAAAIEAL